MTDRDWNGNWNDNWDWLRSPESGDDSQADCESSESHEQTQAKTDESTHSQTIHRRALLQTGLVALGFTGVSSSGSGSGVSAATAPENGGTSKHLAVGAETDELWSQQQKLTAVDEKKSFGGSVAVSTDLNTVFIGAPGDGAAYVFTKSGGTWSQEQKLTANNGDEFDRFGSSMAVYPDLSRVFIGAPGDEVVYVFGVAIADPGGASWGETQKLTASDGDDLDGFGESVAVSDSDGTALIGASSDSNSNGELAGAVYVYTEDRFTWSQQQKLIASDGDDGDGFGESVAMSDDGTTALIGAGGGGDGDTGSAYVFTENGGTWGQQQTLTASDGDDREIFGASMAVSDSDDGMTALVGAEDIQLLINPVEPAGEGSDGEMDAGSVYVFTENGETWSQQQRLTAADSDYGDRFGASIAVSDSEDGMTALVGAPSDSNSNGGYAGSAYVFTENGETLSQQQKLTAADGESRDLFGGSVVLSDDGTTALIGARDDGDDDNPIDENPGGGRTCSLKTVRPRREVAVN